MAPLDFFSRATAQLNESELETIRRIQRQRGVLPDRFFKTATARTPRLAVLALASSIACRERASIRPAASAIAAASVAHGCGAFARRVVDRRRPIRRDRRIRSRLRQPPTSPSFPSTHAASAFGAAVALGRTSSRMRSVLLLGAVTTSMSRVWLGLHYLTDVVAGAALGVFIGRRISSWLDPTSEEVFGERARPREPGASRSTRRFSAFLAGSRTGKPGVTRRRVMESSRTSRSQSATRAELYEEAKRLDIKGRSTMNKAQLARAVGRARSPGSAPKGQGQKPNPVEVQAFLEGVGYPMSRGELVRAAERTGAQDRIRSALERLPDKTYTSPTDVSEAVGELPADANPIEVQACLRGVGYPLTKRELVRRAGSRGADSRVRATLEQLPDQQFESPAAVSEAIGKFR